MSTRTELGARNEAALGEEAAGWLLRVEAPDDDPDREYPNETARNQAFYEWLATSPDHLRVFLETVETSRKLRMIDPDRLIQVETLLRHRADVIPLHKDQSSRKEYRPQQSFTRAVPARRKTLRAAAAVIVVFALGAASLWWSQSAHVYTTSVGEQRNIKLEDGSFVYLNTDSKVEVNFSKLARSLRLVQGEALFVVERDSSRPFTVTAGNTSVRALGTQFDVRRHDDTAEVAVVEGTVQVTADEQSGSSSRKLAAGDNAIVKKGQIAARGGQPVADTLAWRQRRLVFQDARLADVAAEFNRYNRTKIRVEGEAAKEILLSGIFDADRPPALMLYAARNLQLSVEPAGSDWVIRDR